MWQIVKNKNKNKKSVFCELKEILEFPDGALIITEKKNLLNICMFFHIGIHSVGVQTASEESHNSGFNTVLKARHAKGGLSIHNKNICIQISD